MAHSRKYGRGNHPNQYSHEYHLSRAVKCVDCGVLLYKTHAYVYYGNRCRPCYMAGGESGGTRRG